MVVLTKSNSTIGAADAPYLGKDRQGYISTGGCVFQRQISILSKVFLPTEAILGPETGHTIPQLSSLSTLWLVTHGWLVDAQVGISTKCISCGHCSTSQHCGWNLIQGSSYLQSFCKMI